MFRRLGLFLTVLGALAVVSVASAAYPAPVRPSGRERRPLERRRDPFRRDWVRRRVDARSRIQDEGWIDADVAERQWFVRCADAHFERSRPAACSATAAPSSCKAWGPRTRRSSSCFAPIDLGIRDQIVLKGTFAFDALSPDGSKLYLIEHKSVQDMQHYIVRAYDLNAHALVPGRIADKTQKSWVMQGWAVSRVSTTDGRWAYTLYANPGGFPFVHALDTVQRRRALRRRPVAAIRREPKQGVQLQAHPAREDARDQGGHRQHVSSRQYDELARIEALTR